MYGDAVHVMSDTRISSQVEHLLTIGNREFGTTLGALARIEGNVYELVAVESNSGAYVPGEKYALGDSLCRSVFEEQRIISETVIGNTPLTLHHPLYRSLPLECFIGAPVSCNGQPWGCVDFSSMAQRDEAFDERQVELLVSLTHEIIQLVNQFG
jgi:hypothetical protein